MSWYDMVSSIKIVSLFDGISCGMQSFKKSRLPKIDEYCAYEIDKNAMKVANKNHPDIKQFGTVVDANFKEHIGSDFLIGGSPCFIAGTKVLTSVGYKPIEKIKIGDFVLTHKGRYRKVLATGCSINETVFVHINGIPTIESTRNHPFYVKTKNGDTQWVYAENLKSGMMCGIPVVEQNEKSLFLKTSKLNYNDLFKYWRIGSKVKVPEDIPNELYCLDKKYKLEFLKGFVYSNGDVINGNVRVYTKSEDIALCLINLVSICYQVSCKIYTNKIGENVFYKISWNIFDSKNLDFNSNIIWFPFGTVIKRDEKKKVYNIEVEEDNSYTVNNIAVHNCQGFSFAGKQLNFNDSRSKLFFEFVRALEEIKPKYFLLENVVMKKEYEDVITSYLGVNPIMINSSLVSAQNRKRLYWTNIPNVSQPKDKNVKLCDILEDNLIINNISYKKEELHKGSIIGRRIDKNGHRKDYDYSIPIVQCLEVRKTNIDKSNCLTTVSKDNVLTPLPYGRYIDVYDKKLPFRYYTKKEYCRLQTLPDNYCNCVSSEIAKKLIGNAWTVDVIVEILNHCVF